MKTLYAAWSTIGGPETGRKAIEEVAQTRTWAERLGIEALDNRVVYSMSDEGVTLYYREAA